MEKLNCKSLMLGDWVLVERYEGIYGGPVWKQAGKVNGIFQEEVEIRFSDEDDEEDYEPIYYFSSDGLDPIPLTPEILERNGLLDQEHSEYYVRYDKHDEEWYFIYYGSFAEMKVSITAVHELQHCLELVGISKEIVL